jgi:very-short-patch-repair endonuclease
MEVRPVCDAKVDVGAAGDGLAQLAARQHGVVARRQITALGIGRGQVARLVSKAHLHRLYRCVYAVGHTRISLRGRWMAAVLACGSDAVLSHAAAAALWELRGAPTIIDVTAPSKRAHNRIRCHVAALAEPRDLTVIDAIPVTSLERTLMDIAHTLSRLRLRSILEAAQRRDLLDRPRLDAMLAGNTGHRGAGALRSMLGELTDAAPWTQSELERDFLELIREAGLPEPACNVIVAGELVDFYWPAQRLVVEVDGFAFHSSRRAFEANRRLDIKLQVVGLRVIRVTYQQIVRHRSALLNDLRRLLGSAAA